MVSSEGSCVSPNSAAKQYGVTKPISMAGPTKTDRQRSKELDKVWIVCVCVFFLLLLEKVLIIYNYCVFCADLVIIYVFGFWVWIIVFRGSLILYMR